MYIRSILLILITIVCIVLIEGYKSKFEPWYIKAKAILDEVELLKPLEIDNIYNKNSGKLGQSLIDFSCEPFNTSKLRYVRCVSFCGEGYDVFNFVALPWSYYDLPILGIDIVSLPGGSLAAIDFQPLIYNDDSYFQDKSYSLFAKNFNDLKASLPTGGSMPVAAAKYFSPYALWTRLPPHDDRINIIEKACEIYVNSYATLLKDANKIEDALILRKRQDNLKEYLNYRIENDPAKNMLNGAFGVDWTNNVIKEILFPYEN